MSLVLTAERDIGRLFDECSEDDGELNGSEHVKIERLHGDVVQARDVESCFLAYLADCAIFGALIGIESPVNRFPRSGASRIVRALNSENFPSACKRTDDVHVHDTWYDRRHRVP